MFVASWASTHTHTKTIKPEKNHKTSYRLISLVPKLTTNIDLLKTDSC